MLGTKHAAAALSSGKLFVVATPIGNLGDLTFRALETLKNVDYILVEDTRHSIKLLRYYTIEKHLEAYHAHNEHQKTQQVINDLLLNKKQIALITDAGTPSISDPGYLLINSCIKAGITFEYIPGASAFLAALVLSGLPTNPFSFMGFLPSKKGRQKALQQLPKEQTLILYESPHRIIQLLEEIHHLFDEQRPVALVKEISKLNERVYRGSSLTVKQQIEKENPVKGEFVLVIGR